MHCANCDIDMPNARYLREGTPYCCLGCSLGGPCTCEDEDKQQIAVALEREAVGVHDLARSFADGMAEFAWDDDDVLDLTFDDWPGHPLGHSNGKSNGASSVKTIDLAETLRPFESESIIRRISVEVAVTPLRDHDHAVEMVARLGAIGLSSVSLSSFENGQGVYQALAHDPSDAVTFLLGASSLDLAGLRIHDSRIEVQLRPAPLPREKTRRSTGRGWYELGTDVFFNARHFVIIDGKRGPIHPHSWKVRISLQESPLDKNGLVVGFADIKTMVQAEVGRLDSTLLNNVHPFDEIVPTTENVAAVIYHNLELVLSDLPVELRTICVWETPTNYVLYSEED